MVITRDAFNKRFGKEFSLSSSGLKYHAWTISKQEYNRLIPNFPKGKVSHFFDGNTSQIVSITPGNKMTLFTNQKGENLALVSL